MAVWRLQRAYCPVEEWLDWDVNDLSGDNKFDALDLQGGTIIAIGTQQSQTQSQTETKPRERHFNHIQTFVLPPAGVCGRDVGIPPPGKLDCMQFGLK